MLPCTAQHFIITYGEAEAIRVCEHAPMSFGYFRHLVTGQYTPSRKLALRLERASAGRMNAVALLGLQDSARKFVAACEATSA